MTVSLAADVGRTTCRVAADARPVVAVPNGASLADADGADRVLAAVLAAVPDDVRPADVARITVGASGAAQSRGGADALADGLATRFPAAHVTVTSDVVTAHVGALGGGPGVVVIAGTGAVALAVGADGAHHLVDGHGPFVGDAGSGTWIGRRALAAALRHHDGRPGGSAALAAAASVRFGPLDALAGAVQGSSAPWRAIAGFVPDVAAAADAGDPLAASILADAVAEIAATVRAAARAVATTETSGTPVPATLVGGLADLDTRVRAPLAAALAAAAPDGAATGPEVRLVPPAGDALEGARRVADDGPGVHHHLVLDRPAREPRVVTAHHS